MESTWIPPLILTDAEDQFPHHLTRKKNKKYHPPDHGRTIFPENVTIL